MIKYNPLSMQPLTEESEQTSDVQASHHNEPVHELSGQDAAIIARIKYVREVIESLRLKLCVEKDNLARERLEAASMFTFQSTPAVLENFAPLRSLYSIPVNLSNYNGVKPIINPTISDQDYESFVETHNYEAANKWDVDRRKNTKYNYLIDPAVSDAYRGHLQDAEKMCHEEFNKMQASISSLRKIKPQSRENSTDDESLNSVTNVDDNKRLHRRHHRSGHSKHLRKDHHRDHYIQRQSNDILPDVVTTVNEHRSHYYYHYNDRPPKKIYNSRETIKGAIGEYSGDSTETGVALWHLDSPYESDYK